MPTAHDLIRTAYRKIGVVADDEEMTASQAEAGLVALNLMMHGWKAFGIDIGHVDYVLTDDVLPLTPEFAEGTMYQLAQRLSSDYAAQGVDADVFFRALQAAYLVIEDVTTPYALLSTPSQKRRYWTSGY